MNLNTQQEMHLRNTSKANLAERTAKAEIDAWAAREKARRLDEYRNETDRHVRLAYNSGVPKSQIGREGLHTKHPNAVYASLERTAHLAGLTLAPVESDPYAGVYEWDGSTLTITPNADDLAATAKALDWDAATIAADPALRCAAFTVPGGRLDAVGGDFLVEHGNRHPVVVWAYRAENEADALAWLGKQHPEAVAA